MRKASITQTKNQLSALLDRVRHGESVLIMDRGRPVARLEPAMAEGGGGDDEGRLARLERAGIIRRPASAQTEKLLLEPPPKAKRGASALRALLEEREHGR